MELQRLWRGPEQDPTWARPAVICLLGATAVLYLWGLGASGYANAFYSAAVQAGTHSFKAAFFGASDAAGSITVDKSPLFLWPMEISARIFGVNSWSILAPNALEGVAAVGVLYAAVKRWSGPAAGLVAAAVLALTPAATLMFRFNNPDGTLVLLLTMAGYAIVRGLEDGRTRWVVACFALVGLAFLAKMLQAFLVVPPFGFAYLLAGPPKLGRRVWQLALGAIAMFAAAGWWVAIVELTPKSTRPYVGGSQNNSVLNLIFGYNGFGRLTGHERGSVGGRRTPAGGTMWGKTGLFRMFNTNFGGQASWLIPTALVVGAVVVVATITRHRTDRTRAELIIWGGWLGLTALTFSFGKGIIHEYYTVALAPGVGGTIGVAGAYLWRKRTQLWSRCTCAVALIVSTAWTSVLLHRTPHWNPWLMPGVIVVAAAVVVFLIAGPVLGTKVMAGAVAAAIGVGLVGPAAYSLNTARARHAGAIPSAGPSGQGRRGPGGLRRSRLQLNELTGVAPQFTGGRRFPGGPQFGSAAPPRIGPGHGGLIGGLLEESRPDAALVAYLLKQAKSYQWIAATVGSNEAAGYQLATDKSVMPIGGFNGTDPSPTLVEFRNWVSARKIHYFISTGRGLGGPGTHGGGAGPRSGPSRAIRAWVADNFSSTIRGRVIVFDLTKPRRLTASTATGSTGVVA